MEAPDVVEISRLPFNGEVVLQGVREVVVSGPEFTQPPEQMVGRVHVPGLKRGIVLKVYIGGSNQLQLRFLGGDVGDVQHAKLGTQVVTDWEDVEVASNFDRSPKTLFGKQGGGTIRVRQNTEDAYAQLSFISENGKVTISFTKVDQVS